MNNNWNKEIKHKQHLCEKFLKTRCKKAENAYKNYKNLFEQIKKRAKRLPFSNLIRKYKSNNKLTWSVVKEVIGKNSSWRQNFSNKINLGSKFITSTDSVAKNFNKYFTEIGPSLANRISTLLANFDTYLNNKCNIFQLETPLSMNELNDAFYSLKTNRSPGYDSISSSIIKQCFGTLNRPLHYIYNISLQTGIFPEMKIARVAPVFKGNEVPDLGNYRPISVLCCFSKILEKIIYHLYKLFIRNNLDFKKTIQLVT